MSRSEIHWRDVAGRVHRCRIIEHDETIVVTSCKFDVPAGEAYEMEPSDPPDPITCPLCLSGEMWGGTVAERLSLPPPKSREP